MVRYSLELPDLLSALSAVEGCADKVNKIKHVLKCSFSDWDRHVFALKNKAIIINGKQDSKVLIDMKDYILHENTVKDWNAGIDAVYKMVDNLAKSIKQLETDLSLFKEKTT